MQIVKNTTAKGIEKTIHVQYYQRRHKQHKLKCSQRSLKLNPFYWAENIWPIQAPFPLFPSNCYAIVHRNWLVRQWNSITCNCPSRIAERYIISVYSARHALPVILLHKKITSSPSRNRPTSHKASYLQSSNYHGLT